ncbi:MAG: hypothetical protein U0354_14080 [Candidatus Sericytochromatia bacterium]
MSFNYKILNEFTGKEEEKLHDIFPKAEELTNSCKYIESFEFQSFNLDIEIGFSWAVSYTYTEMKYIIFLIAMNIFLSKEKKIELLDDMYFQDQETLEKLVKLLEIDRTAFYLFLEENPSCISKMAKIKYDNLEEWQEIKSNYPSIGNKKEMIINSPEFKNFNTKVVLDENKDIVFDEKYFLFLFANSLSLSANEKLDILIDKLPKLIQFQIDELIHTLEDERFNFDMLAIRNPEQVQDLRNDAKAEWNLIEQLF